jgi:DNA-binding FadR family transcriptional regulator
MSKAPRKKTRGAQPAALPADVAVPDVVIAPMAEGEATQREGIDRFSLSGTLAVPVRGKRAERIARELEDEIIARGWPVGEVLGSEADFIERLGISRSVFREAVRLLEHHDVARMRRGPGGGLVVTAPQPLAAGRVMALTLEYMGATVEDLLEARSALELKAVELASARINEEGVRLLRQACADEARAQAAEGSLGNHDIHRVIAQLSGNPAFVVILEVLTRLTDDALPGGPPAPMMASQVRHAHDKIAEAIISRDAALARHRMQAHLEAMAMWLASKPDSRRPS